MNELEDTEKEVESKNEINRVLIIGGGIAGLSCADAARKNADKAEITIISNEGIIPYYRLNLIKYLDMETDEKGLTIYPESWYQEKRINLICNKRVMEIRKEAKQILLEDGTILSYEKLVIANGALPFVPRMKGTDFKNVITVRTIVDANRILQEIEKIQSCVCIGGGILGLEVAGAIAKHGKKVTVLVNSQWLMPRQLNKNAANKLKRYLQGLGIEVRENITVQEIEGQNNCEGVVLSTGEVLPTKLVIIAAGVSPDVQLALSAGLKVNKGILVDNEMRSSDENIFAAGDVAEHSGTLYGLWSVAQQQGKIAGQRITGMDTQFLGVSRTNILKVVGIDMISIGELSILDESYYQYEKETTDGYITFILRDGKIVGSIVMGDKTLSVKVKMAIDKGVDFPRETYVDCESIMGKLMNK